MVFVLTCAHTHTHSEHSEVLAAWDWWTWLTPTIYKVIFGGLHQWQCELLWLWFCDMQLFSPCWGSGGERWSEVLLKLKLNTALRWGRSLGNWINWRICTRFLIKKSTGSALRLNTWLLLWVAAAIWDWSPHHTCAEAVRSFYMCVESDEQREALKSNDPLTDHIRLWVFTAFIDFTIFCTSENSLP